MNKIKYYIFLLIYSSLYLSCNTVDKDKEVWMGAGFYYRDAIEYPSLLILNYSENKLFNISSKSEKSVSSVDTMNINGSVFSVSYKKNNILVYRSVQDSDLSLVFHKATKTSRIESFNKLYKNSWKEKISNIKESFDLTINHSFKNNKWLVNRKYYLNKDEIFNEKEEYKLDTLSYQGYKFLIQEGKKYSRLFQLSGLNEKELCIIANDSFNGYQKELEQTNMHIENDFNSTFQICNEHQIGEYYYRKRGTRYKGGKRFLSNYFLEQYSFAIDSSQNGYVRIRFIVNCEGQTGRFSIQEMDTNYKEVPFNPKITSQLFSLTRNLNEWIVYSSDKKEAIDTHKHLTFKIKNGQIEEILP